MIKNTILKSLIILSSNITANIIPHIFVLIKGISTKVYYEKNGNIKNCGFWISENKMKIDAKTTTVKDLITEDLTVKGDITYKNSILTSGGNSTTITPGSEAITNKQVNKEREIDDWYIRQRGGR